jgi:hypothetical protein
MKLHHFVTQVSFLPGDQQVLRFHDNAPSIMFGTGPLGWV